MTPPALNPPPATTGARVLARRFHVSPGGIAYAVTTFVLVLGAVKSQNNLLFALFGLGLAGIIVSGLISGSALMGLDVSREVPPHAVAGAELAVHYRLRTRARLVPALALTIEELPDTDARDRLGGCLLAFVPCVRARGLRPARTPPHTLARASIVPQRRGVLRLARFRVSTSFPFGLARKSVTFEQPAEFPIRPAPARVLPAANAPAGPRAGHAARERRHRAGDEFFALRDYSPGDSLRSVSWRASARAGSLVVRERATRPHPRLALALREPADDLARERVLSLAAGIVHRAARSGEEFSFALDAGPSLLPPGAGPRHADRALDLLASLPDRAWASSALIAPPTSAPADPPPALLVHAESGPHQGAISPNDPSVSFPPLVALGHPAPPPTPKAWWRSLLGDGE